jgi:hypothetical protein
MKRKKTIQSINMLNQVLINSLITLLILKTMFQNLLMILIRKSRKINKKSSLLGIWTD